MADNPITLTDLAHDYKRIMKGKRVVKVYWPDNGKPLGGPVV